LKSLWLLLINEISKDSTLAQNQLVNSGQYDDLFRASAYDDPDILILRWLRARKFDADAAVRQLIDTLKWRREWGVDKLIANGEKELVEDELLTDKSYFLGKDRENRPVIYIHAKDHIKDEFPVHATQKLAILSVETGRKLLEYPTETVTIVIDMNGFSMSNMDYQLVKFFIFLLENHYPESLGLALILHAPFIFQSCWSIIRHWLDPVVEAKIRFIRHVDDLQEYIHSNSIPRRLNGTHPDYHYIPPTDEDLKILKEFHNDKQGRKIVRANHRKAMQIYLDLTLKWAKGDDSVIEQRKQATKQLRDTFEKLVPYFQTRTSYHRAGIIHEPIFDTVYHKICANKESNIVEF